VVGAVANRAVTIVGIATPLSSALPAVLSVSASVDGGIPSASRVEYALHPPGDNNCQSPLADGSVAIAGMGNAPPFATNAATAVGVHRWQAKYNGNAWNLPQLTVCTAPLMSVTLRLALFADGFE
jgi:hypothetical protein